MLMDNTDFPSATQASRCPISRALRPWRTLVTCAPSQAASEIMDTCFLALFTRGTI